MLRSVKASLLSVMQFIGLKQNLFPLVLMEIYFVKVSITTKQILRRFFLLPYPRTKGLFNQTICNKKHIILKRKLNNYILQLCTFQVGSFNYAMDRIVFMDEFVPTEKDRVRSILGKFLIKFHNTRTHLLLNSTLCSNKLCKRTYCTLL
jgi:hypothetical protein